MHATRKTNKGGFTLVEILIVVIILGILAAIVIPQFTNASQDARKNSLTSQLQTLRSQIELYKLQHQDNAPNLVGTGWTLLTQKTTSAGAVSTTGTCGPYLQQVPINPLNSNSAIVNGDGTAAPATGKGWVYDYTGTGKVWATGQVDTKYFNEPDPSGSDLATAP